jgi:hypothetical protein
VSEPDRDRPGPALAVAMLLGYVLVLAAGAAGLAWLAFG